MGVKSVVIKGGHLKENSCEDCLCQGGSFQDIHWFSSPRIQTKNTHGTGCTFSAAIAAYLSKGFEILESVNMAKQYITQCIEKGASYSLGQGNGPVHHFFAFWGEQDKD
jgi:hydroxymethylpyrimidine/phosphomethylpyrimidine kinase